MTTHSHQVDILQKALALIAIVTNYRLIWNISRKARTGISNTVIQLIMSSAGIRLQYLGRKNQHLCKRPISFLPRGLIIGKKL